MRIRVDYFIDDRSVEPYLEIEDHIKYVLRQSADYQHGNITVCAEHGMIGDCVDVTLYTKDFEHQHPSRSAIDKLHQYLRTLLP